MKFIKLLIITTVIFTFSVIANAQTKTAKVSQAVKSSAAYAEVLLRTTELESELQELLVSYTKEFPKVKVLRYELLTLQEDLDNMSNMNATQAKKLTLALGKLLVRKAQLATNYWSLKQRYSDAHPSAKKAKSRLQIYENAVNKILN